MNKKNIKKYMILFFITVAFCMNIDSNIKASESVAARENSAKIFKLSLDYYEKDKMKIADGWSNGGMFNCAWDKNNVTFNDKGNMELSINKNINGKYTGAEYRSNRIFGYGYYKIKMKPIKNDGVVSSFFMYTGPSNGTQWDEIDIEFLGKNTNIVQFNYYTNGVGHHEFIYDLGYDASEGFHTYAFEWLKDSISWYVDGIKVHTATENIPLTPGQIMMNVWNGTGVDAWLNPYDGKIPLKAEYSWMYYYSLD